MDGCRGSKVNYQKKQQTNTQRALLFSSLIFDFHYIIITKKGFLACSHKKEKQDNDETLHHSCAKTVSLSTAN
jgi:hypothetical protein